MATKETNSDDKSSVIQSPKPYTPEKSSDDKGSSSGSVAAGKDKDDGGVKYEVKSGKEYEEHGKEPCFAKGTLISTVKGLVAVEKLKVGDEVLTIDGEHAPIVWLGHRRVNCVKHSVPEMIHPVCVSKDAFGPGMPNQELFLSPAHAVYAYGHLVPVRHLINDVTITQEARDSVTYYHIELPKHTVIFAQGLPAETYLDSDNRQFFISADQVASNVEKLDTVEFSENYGRDLYLANCYAPFVTEGPVLEAIQEKLLAMPAAERLALAA